MTDDTDLEEYAQATMPAPPSLAASPGTNPQLAFSDPAYLRGEDSEDADEHEPADLNRFANADESDDAGGGGAFGADFERRLDERLKPIQQERSQLRTKALEAEKAGIGQMDETIKRLEARQRPQMQQLPEQPQAFGQQMVQYLQITALVGALAGSLVRGNTTAALNAYAGAVTGFMKGNKEVYEAKAQEWKMASERIKADNQARLDAYDAALKDEQLTATAKLNRIKAVASMYDDQITWNLSDQKDIVNVAMTIERQKQLAQNAEESRRYHDKLIEKIDNEMKTQSDPKYKYGRGIEGGLMSDRVTQFKKENPGVEPTADQLAEMAQDIRAGLSGARMMGSRAGGLLGIIGALDEQIGPAIELSNKIPRNFRLPPVNRIQEDAKRLWDKNPDVANFLMDNYTIADLYAKALNPTGVARLEQIEHALRILDRGYSTGTYAAALQHLQETIRRERAGTLKSLHGAGGGGMTKEDTAAPQPPAAPAAPAKPDFTYDPNTKKLVPFTQAPTD